MWVLLLFLIAGGVAAFVLLPQLKGWRTQIFGSLVSFFVGIVPFASDLFTFLQTVDWTRFNFGPKTLAAIGLGIGLMICVLRYMTTGKVGQK